MSDQTEFDFNEDNWKHFIKTFETKLIWYIVWPFINELDVIWYFI